MANSLNVFKVKSIKLEDQHPLKNTNSYTRTLTIESNNGDIEIILFSDDRKSLDLTFEARS